MFRRDRQSIGSSSRLFISRRRPYRAVSARLLGAIKRLIHPFEQRDCRFPGLSDSHSQADRHGMGRVGGYGAGRIEQGVGQLLQLGFVGDGQQQGKLFTPDTGRQRTRRAVLL